VKKIQLELDATNGEKNELASKQNFLESEYNYLEHKLSQQEQTIQMLQQQIATLEDQNTKLEEISRIHQLSKEELNRALFDQENRTLELKTLLLESQRAVDEKGLKLDFLMNSKDEEVKLLTTQLDSNKELLRHHEADLRAKLTIIDEQKATLQENYTKLLQSEIMVNKLTLQNEELSYKSQLQHMEVEQRNNEISNLRNQLNEAVSPLVDELHATRLALSQKDEEIAELRLNVTKLDESVNIYRESFMSTSITEDSVKDLKKQNHKLKEEVKRLTVKVKKDREFLKTLKKNLTNEAKEKENTKTSILEKVVTKDKQIAKLNNMLEQSIKEVTVESIMNASFLGSRNVRE
jgi:chromosome segregation ATPase